MNETLAQRVVRWQREHGRHDLPWQNTRDPYRVWLSEIMLQQTQVSTVLDYFDRFLARFPDVAALAAAEQDEVLGLWSGLGYYSRARNLHACARQVVELHGGAFPRSAEVLTTLPGIGRSTAAAIASFCFEERVAILDGNVKRVLTRALGFGDDLAVAAHERRLWDLATALLPEAPAGGSDAGRSPDMPAYTQGLMDLGATVCLARSPACPRCPLASRCRALAEGDPLAYPVRTRKLKRSQREHWWLWLQSGDAIWLEQRADTGVWAGLWTLPLYEDVATLRAATEALPGPGLTGGGAALSLRAAEPGLPGDLPPQVETLPDVHHVLTHFDWLLHPRRLQLPPGMAAQGAPLGRPGRWVRRQELADLALPAPLRKLLA